MNRIILNKQAGFDYQIIGTCEAGIALEGDEIKAVRSGRANLKGSYAKIFYKKGRPELFLVGSHFHSNNLDPYRTRKLLVHKNELKHLIGKTVEKGLTLVPLSLYFKRGLVKAKIGIAQGLKNYDKREIIKKRDQEREIETKLKRRIG